MEKKTNCIECFLYIITGIIALIGLIYLIGNTSYLCTNKYVLWLLITISLVGFIIFLTFSVWSLIHFYFREDGTKRNESTWDKIGGDIARIFSWLFSVNGFLFIILCAIVALIIFFICRFSGCCCGDVKNELELTALTLTISLAAIIPTIITKIVAEKEIDKKIDERHKIYETSLTNHMHIILKETAHSSRMFAVLLYQMASLQKKSGDFEDALKKTFWSIGWGSKAITQYLIIKDGYSNALELSNELLNEHLLESIKEIESCESEIIKTNPNWEEEKKNKNLLRRRDLKSVFQAHALMKKYNVLDNVDNDLDNLEVLLSGYLKIGDFPNAKECKIKEKDDDFNEELEEKADNIIKKIKSKVGA